MKGVYRSITVSTEIEAALVNDEKRSGQKVSRLMMLAVEEFVQAGGYMAYIKRREQQAKEAK